MAGAWMSALLARSAAAAARVPAGARVCVGTPGAVCSPPGRFPQHELGDCVGLLALGDCRGEQPSTLRSYLSALRGRIRRTRSQTTHAAAGAGQSRSRGPVVSSTGYTHVGGSDAHTHACMHTHLCGQWVLQAGRLVDGPDCPRHGPEVQVGILVAHLRCGVVGGAGAGCVGRGRVGKDERTCRGRFGVLCVCKGCGGVGEVVGVGEGGRLSTRPLPLTWSAASTSTMSNGGSSGDSGSEPSSRVTFHPLRKVCTSGVDLAAWAGGGGGW